MVRDLSIVAPPIDGLYRLAPAIPGPFEPRSWTYARPDGTFGNRFDDPAIHLSEGQRFQVLYCATRRHVVFGETLALLRPSLPTLVGLAGVHDDEPLDATIGESIDPESIPHGLVRADWRVPKVVGHTVLEPHLRFVDLTTAQTSQHLRRALAQQAVEHGASDIDQSLLMESRRDFTRQVARYIYEQREEGFPRFAGIRYLSRLDSNWECWAIFVDRMQHVAGMPSVPQTIPPDDEDLLNIAALFDLTIETVDGSGRYYRP